MVGWSASLAAKAADFHRLSESIACSGAWAAKAFIFFSVIPGATMLELNLGMSSEVLNLKR
jgi:hypothetical protein